ncbi:hypothetical protein [Corynebacterium doosanense]|uniref:Secreted protein n=1 Tax=Corynebacterium doosanense CAU 212 = DSM 45436 TaxID=558173 RepID=A0A097IJK3_9CORY|nr:hypothetical protein [Corynebacterium doosanense]AIT62283.1 hypothetical protein CDOO_07930 [Corynebacterium doosanense CAU 212 = DSM 45436]
MNKFRNSLVAVATAFAVTTAGVSVASAAEADSSSLERLDLGSSNTGTETDTPTEPGQETDNGSSDYFFDDEGEFEIKKLTGIFTAITGAIGVLTAIYTFVNRFTK